MRSHIEILKSIAVTKQGQAAAAWRDIRGATFVKDFPADGMKGLLANYEAARAAEMDAINAWKAALSA